MNIFHYMSRHIVRLLPVLFFLLAFLRPMPASAGKMVLHVYYESPKERVSLIPYRMLLSRMEMVVKKNGFEKGKSGDRFLLAPVVTVVSRDSQPGAPAKIQLKLMLKLSVGDGLEGTKFATVNIPLEGSGHNDTEAYVEAYRKITADHKEIVALLKTARENIAAYYTKNCNAIIKDAQALSAKGQNEDALFKLLLIPDTCAECMKSAGAAALPIYQKYLDQNATLHLGKAKKVWTKEQNHKNAQTAYRHLSLIDPESAGYAEAQQYYEQISNYLKKDGKQITTEMPLQKPYEGDEKIAARNRDYGMIVDKGLKDAGTTTTYQVSSW